MNAPESQSNQRSFPRVPARSNVWLQCRSGASGSVDVANGLLDISGGGVQFLAKELLHPGGAVEIVLSGSGIGGSIRRRGEVRWVVPLGADACCAGVRFLEPLSAEEWNDLANSGQESATPDETGLAI